MTDRLCKLAERQQSNHGMLTWFGLAAAGTVIAAIAFANNAQAQVQHAQTAQEEGVMLRPGSWTQDNGSYVLPQTLDANPRNWPTSGWYRVTHKDSALQVQAVTAPARGMPDFLREIAVQVMDPAAPATARSEVEAEEIDTRYIRMPDTTLAEGRMPTVKFLRGVLVPRVDHPYELALDSAPFTLIVQNGLRNKAGVAYGDGAVYTIRMGEESYSFHVKGGNGLESRIVFAADLDGDHKPDFVVRVGDQETLLMSSRARGGLTPPAATLAQLNEGC